MSGTAGVKRRARARTEPALTRKAPKGARGRKAPREMSPPGPAERYLERAVFGDPEDLLDALRAGPGAQPLARPDAPGSEAEATESEESGDEGPGRRGAPVAKQPAWQDEEEEDAAPVDLRHRFRRELVRGAGEDCLPRAQLQGRLCDVFRKAMGGAPGWAERRPAAEEQQEEGGLEWGTGQLLRPSSTLPAGPLLVRRCPAANQARPAQARLSSVRFHPAASVLLAAGLDRSLGLFQVDGGAGGLIQSLHIEDFPVHRARFTPDGRQVVASGERSRSLYLYDMMGGGLGPWQPRGLAEPWLRAFELSPDGAHLLLSGASGYLHLLSMRTKELIGSVKMNGRSAGVAFSTDGAQIYSSDDEGQVYVWDVGSRRCLHRFTDEGCLRATCLAASRDGRYLACGSSSGVVNVYAKEDCMQQLHPRPLKALMNLTTCCSALAFNPTSEILAMASSTVDEAVRLVHIPTLTVFPNFPVFKRKTIYLAQSLDFSPGSGFFAIANNKGTALLYRLKHYSSF